MTPINQRTVLLMTAAGVFLVLATMALMKPLMNLGWDAFHVAMLCAALA